MLKPWLRLFRVVNLPTVPGDVLAGAASFSLAANCYAPAKIAWASVASVLIYMFGLIDNDIVGAKTDKGRPIPDGEISLTAARIARALCIFAVIGAAWLGELPFEWYPAAMLLILMIAVYNRTKVALFMGCCRGLNVGCGFAVSYGIADVVRLDWVVESLPFVVAAVFTIYITAVTKYSEGEELDPERKRMVGMLIGAHVYLQLLTLIVFALMAPHTMPLLIAGAVLLVLLRTMKHALPRVSAS